MDEDGLVLRASRRSTRAPILASLGARIGVRDSSATSSTHRAAAFAALSAPKRVAFVHYTFDRCVHCHRACVAGILYPLVVSAPLSRLHLVLVHAVTDLLCSVSSSSYHPKPLALLVVCFVLAIVVLICRFRVLVDCCIDALLALWPASPQLRTLLLKQSLVSGSNTITSVVPN